MKQTVAIIGSLDTKSSEIAYMIQEIEHLGFDALLFDTSGLQHSVERPVAQVTNTMLIQAAGYDWEQMTGFAKNQRLDIITKSVSMLVRLYYEAGKFQGILSAGGMQNTLIAKTAMSVLPYGFPKVNIAPSATVVEVDDALGRMDDVVTVNSIADIGGRVNAVTAQIMKTGIAALIGMMQYGAGELKRSQVPLIGVMNLGVMAKGAVRAADLISENGMEACMFHGTMHGAVVEKLIEDGILQGVMMLCVHDILTEALDMFRFCKIPVLKAAAQKRIPTLISLSGMDVIDMSDTDFYADTTYGFRERKYHFHNDFCVHVKVTKEEIIKGGALLAERVNAFRSPVTVMMPHRGFRTLTQPGEPLYDPEVDQALITYLHEHLNPEVRIIDVEANTNDELFSRTAAEEMGRLMREGGEV